MSQWIVTPDKFLTDEESKRLRKSCEEAAIIAKSKGNQLSVRIRLIIGRFWGSVFFGAGFFVSPIFVLIFPCDSLW